MSSKFLRPLLALFSVCICQHSLAQQGVGIGPSSVVPLEMLDVDGAIKIGTTTGTNAGTIRWNGTNFQGYDGTQWVNFGATGNDGDWTINGNDLYSSVSGNVGMGTASPLAKLHVSATATGETGGLRLTQPGSTTFFYHSANGDLIIRKASEVDQLVLDQGGNVGIGTSTPTQKLQVQGSIRMVDGNQAAGYIPVSDVNGAMTWTDPSTLTTANDADWTVSGNDIYNANSGNVGIGTTTPVALLDVVSAIDGDETTGMRLTVPGATGYVYMSQNNDVVLRKANRPNQLVLDVSGNVGIGTAAPNEALQVQGSIRMVDGNQQDGFIAVSDANGSMTWTNPDQAAPSKIADDDIDTRVEVERTADDDLIRFRVGGTDQWQMTGRRIEPSNTNNSLHIGQGAGQAEVAFATAYNVFLGNLAGSSNTNGRRNVAVGYRAFENGFGSSNVAIGTYALKDLSGSNTGNVAIGHGAGEHNDGAYNVFLGFDAGSNEPGSRKLYIDVSSTASPLIYGDFLTNDVGINGDLGIGTHTPQEDFHVVGSILMDDGNQQAGYLPVSDANGVMVWTDPNTITTSDDGDWTVNGTNIHNQNSGNVGIGTANPSDKLHIIGSSHFQGTTLFNGNINTNNQWISGDGGSEGLYIADNGRVGVGTNNPSRDFEVNGSSRFQGTTLFGGILNTNNQWISGDGDAEGIYVADDGDVGVGTNSPDYKVHLRTATTSATSPITVLVLDAHDDSNTYNLEAGAGTRLRFKIPGQSGSDNGASIDAEKTVGTELDTQTNLVFRTSDNDNTLDRRMTITSNGRVGIGVSAPTRAKVEISGTVHYNGVSDVISSGSTTTGNPAWISTNGVDDYSLYTSGAISVSQIHVRSDERIKNIVGVSNTASDLDLLRKIEITDYTHKDTYEHGKRPVKKVIAQQVAQVYPQAVYTNTVSTVPDIMKQATIQKGRVALEDHGLQANEMVELIFGTDRKLVEVVSIDACSFTVDLDREGEVFVYGRQVNDLHQVDYDALSMLNISATQELAKRIDELELENAELRSLLKSAEADNSERIERLEALLQINLEAKR